MMVFALIIQASLIGAPDKDPIALLQGLRNLDRELVQLEGELQGLKSKEAKIQEEIASLDIELSETGIKRDQVTQALQKRIRALEKMPGGARMIALGTTQSLQDYLQISRMLRWIAKHDQTLKKEHEEQAAKTQSIKDKQLGKARILEEVSEDIKARRESLGKQRRHRMETTEKLLSNANHLQLLSAEHVQAYKRLQRTFGKLQPISGLSGSFANNARALPWPLVAPVEAGFGTVRELAYGTRLTNFGLLFKPVSGTAVQAVFSGKVVYADWLDGYGQLVIIDHGQGYHSLYGHLAHIEVAVNQNVKTTQSIGSAGDTGSWSGTRLYFEIRSQGQAQDPMLWLRR
jgi:septal ring factor EnvC (AmiA/AmiB activator)